MKSIYLLLLCLVINNLNGQVGRIGINEKDPKVELDIKTFLVDDGSEINLGNLDNSHYLRLFSGRQNFPSPIIYWKPGDPLVFGTNTIGLPDFTEWMRIQSNGRVGVGVQDPLNNFHIKSPEQTGLTIEAKAKGPFIQLTSSTSGPLITESEWTIKNDINNDKSFEINYNNGDHFTIDSFGQLGIRTDDPTTTLDINGSLRVRGLAVFPSPLLSQSNGFINSYNPVIAVNASSFHCSVISHETPYISSGRFALGSSGSSCIEMVSPVQLMHEDVINSMTIRYYDQSSVKNLKFTLFRLDQDGVSHDLIEMIPNDNSTTFTVLIAIGAFTSHTVDNLNSSYYITVNPVNSSGTNVVWDSSISIVSVHIQ